MLETFLSCTIKFIQDHVGEWDAFAPITVLLRLVDGAECRPKTYRSSYTLGRKESVACIGQ